MRGLYGMSRNLNQLAKMGHISGYPEVSAQNEKLAKEISGIIAQMLHDRKHHKG